MATADRISNLPFSGWWNHLPRTNQRLSWIFTYANCRVHRARRGEEWQKAGSEESERKKVRGKKWDCQLLLERSVDPVMPEILYGWKQFRKHLGKTQRTEAPWFGLRASHLRHHTPSFLAFFLGGEWVAWIQMLVLYINDTLSCLHVFAMLLRKSGLCTSQKKSGTCFFFGWVNPQGKADCLSWIHHSYNSYVNQFL